MTDSLDIRAAAAALSPPPPLHGPPPLMLLLATGGGGGGGLAARPDHAAHAAIVALDVRTLDVRTAFAFRAIRPRASRVALGARAP